MLFNKIDLDVKNRIKYECDRIGYNFICAERKSKHPDDQDLYVVVAKRKNAPDYYTFWSCYNDARQTLNHGHYGYERLNKCIFAAKKFVT